VFTLPWGEANAQSAFARLENAVQVEVVAKIEELLA
jgi:hypothetical protein